MRMNRWTQEKFIRFSWMWREMPLELRQRWALWAKSSKKYTSGYNAFIGLNMLALSCGMETPRQNPPPRNQPRPPKPPSPTLAYVYGRIMVDYIAPKMPEVESYGMRLWFSSSQLKMHNQITAIIDPRDKTPIFIDRIPAHHTWMQDAYIELSSIKGPAIVKAYLDVVAAAKADAAPLVSEPSEVSEVVIAN